MLRLVQIPAALAMPRPLTPPKAQRLPDAQMTPPTSGRHHSLGAGNVGWSGANTLSASSASTALPIVT